MKQRTESTKSASGCWLICTSPDNFQLDRQKDFSVEEFKAGLKRLVSEVKPGDKFAIYIRQLQCFGATLRSTGRPYTDEQTRIWARSQVDGAAGL